MNTSTCTNWWVAGNRWLCDKANTHFAQWVKTTSGKRWSQDQYKKKPRSPSYFGYVQPDWMYDARECLSEGDEEGFKFIKLNHI